MYLGQSLEREEWVGQQREERSESHLKAMISPHLLPDVAATTISIMGSKHSPEGRKGRWKEKERLDRREIQLIKVSSFWEEFYCQAVP